MNQSAPDPLHQDPPPPPVPARNKKNGPLLIGLLVGFFLPILGYVIELYAATQLVHLLGGIRMVLPLIITLVVATVLYACKQPRIGMGVLLGLAALLGLVLLLVAACFGLVAGLA